MTKMTVVRNVANEPFRICTQKTEVTCGPAACLIMWANVFGMDPAADEGGVIALSRLFPDPWTFDKGANIANLVRVLGQMGVQTELQRHDDQRKLRDSLNTRVAPKKPALVFLKWSGTAKVFGHFVVAVSTAPREYRYTLLDPKFGLQESYGMADYVPTEDDTLTFTGACAVMA